MRRRLNQEAIKEERTRAGGRELCQHLSSRVAPGAGAPVFADVSRPNPALEAWIAGRIAPELTI